MNAAFIPPDHPDWRAVLGRVRYDFYHLPEYVAFAARHEGGKPAAFLAQDGERFMLVPLLLRPLPPELDAPASWQDATSPYGYPAPLVHPGATTEQVAPLLDALIRCCCEQQLITLFLRHHPLLPLPLGAFSRCGALVHHGRTVCVDLSKDEDLLWHDTRENHRRGIMALQRAGFSVRFDDASDWPAFVALYSETMARHGAGAFYHFPLAYFQDLSTTLGEKLHLCAVLAPDGSVAAAGLFVMVNGLVQYHLGGTAERYLQVAPSKLMFHAVCGWAKSRGGEDFHLGGGVGGRDDSLYRFKAGFSSSTAEFHTSRIVVDQERYQWLNDRFFQGRDGTTGMEQTFFPLYRSDT